MRFLSDRFLISVVIITATVIFGMFIFNRRVDKEIRPDISSKSVSTTHGQPEVKSSFSVVQSLPSRGPFRVIRVIDGDTIVLDNGETVRLIGVDAP